MWLHRNQVMHTPQNYIMELIIWISTPLVTSRMQQWIDYRNIEPTSHFKSMANGFNVQRHHFNIEFWNNYM